MPRFYCPIALRSGDLLDLPASAARHVQVLRLQPGEVITLFNGAPQHTSSGGEYEATITRMGRGEVQVRVGAHMAVQREAVLQVHLAVGMPANERMDWLVEKATELGVASIQPLTTERSVLRLSGERADKKQAHWQSVAVAACEQCGANQVPRVHAVMTLAQWLKAQIPISPTQQRILLSLRRESRGLRDAVQTMTTAITFLSGPEGGLSMAEEDAALAQGFEPVSLGPRVLRSETAALAVLASLLT